MHVKEFLKYLNIVMDSDVGWWGDMVRLGLVNAVQGSKRSEAVRHTCVNDTQSCSSANINFRFISYSY